MKKLNKKQKELLKERFFKILHIICYVCTGLFLLFLIIGGVQSCDSSYDEVQAGQPHITELAPTTNRAKDFTQDYEPLESGKYMIFTKDYANSYYGYSTIYFDANSLYELKIFRDVYDIEYTSSGFHSDEPIVYDYTLNSLSEVYINISDSFIKVHQYSTDITLAEFDNFLTDDFVVYINAISKTYQYDYNADLITDLPSTMYVEYAHTDTSNVDYLRRILEIFGWCFGVAYGSMLFEIAPGLTLGTIFLFPIVIACLLFAINALKGI